MNKIEDRKPKEGSSVIAKTASNILIPCLYEKGKFFKIIFYDKLEKHSEVEVVEWQYEIQIPEPVIADDIFLELFCQKETLIQDNGTYSKFIDAWNSLNIEDRILLVSSITKMLKERQI
jgi:hypothetical protein